MREPPSALLVLPAPGDGAMRSILRKLRLLAFGRLLEASVESPGLGLRLTRLQQALARIARGPARQLLIEAIGQIDVLAPILTMESGLAAPDGLLTKAVPPLLLALGRCEITETILWDVPVAHIVDTDGRLLSFSPPAQGLLVDRSGALARTSDGARLTDLTGERRVMHLIEDGIHLCELDTNPLATVEAHPDKRGNAVELSGRSPSAWCDALRVALSLIEAALPHLRREIGATLQRVIPVGYSDTQHESASFREAPGLVYLSLHPSPLTLAEALVHETQHGKLNALSWFDPLLSNGHDTWTSSPVRPDLRPLHGVLMAVHAFVPVAALHARLAELGHPAAASDERKREVIAANELGLTTLRELAQPTKLGKRVLNGLQELHAAVQS